MKQQAAQKQSTSHLSRTLHVLGSRMVDSRRRLGTVAAVALACLLAYHVVVGNNGVNVYKQKLSDDKALAAELKELQQANERLKKHVEHLESDPDAIEHEAQIRLHYTRPGQVIVLNDGMADRTADPVQKTPTR